MLMAPITVLQILSIESATKQMPDLGESRGKFEVLILAIRTIVLPMPFLYLPIELH